MYYKLVLFSFTLKRIALFYAKKLFNMACNTCLHHAKQKQAAAKKNKCWIMWGMFGNHHAIDTSYHTFCQNRKEQGGNEEGVLKAFTFLIHGFVSSYQNQAGTFKHTWQEQVLHEL